MPSRETETWSAAKEMSHGAVMLEGGLTRFALWAPEARSVSLLLEAHEPQPMTADDEGWYQLKVHCKGGSAYRYLIDDDLAVPDPASRAQQGDVHSPSLVVDAHYPWQQTGWHGRPWHEAVIYEIHVGAMGGFAKVETHLARLAALGITTLELMPVSQFPGERNWGYDGVLPYAPQSSYGTPAQLKHLIDSAHGHGLMVILDVVYNHFGPDGNYLGVYAKRFFNQDKHTPWGAAIDFSQAAVRDFFIDNALMWLHEYRFDGLRFDAVHAIESPDFLQVMAKRIRTSLEPRRHVYLTLENEHNQARLLKQGYDAQWNDDGHNALHVLLTGETEAYYEDYQDRPTEKLARCLREGFVYQGHINRHGEARGEPSGHLPPSAFVLFLQNHDQIGNRAFGERLAHLCSEPALRAATTLLLLCPMIPLMFMGDEWAAQEPFLFFTSHHGELAEAVREGRRGEFAAFSAFADPQKRERIPDPNAPETFDASRPDFDSFSAHQNGPWVDLYRELLTWRRREIAPRLPGTHSLGASVLADKAISASWRMGDGSELRIDLNLSAVPVETTLPAAQFRLFDSRLRPDTASQLTAYTTLVSLIPPAGFPHDGTGVDE